MNKSRFEGARLQPCHHQPPEQSALAAEVTSLPESPIVSAHGNIRGTQSFVHVMASIFKRLGLVGIEIGWRWIAFTPILYVGFNALRHTFNGNLLGDGTFLSPMVPATVRFYATLLWWQAIGHGLSGLDLLSDGLYIACWAIICGLMRGVVLQRLDPQLAPQRAATIGLSLLRIGCFLLLVFAWVAMLNHLWKSIMRGSEPAYVPAFALATIGTLLLFMLWSVTSWIFPLATTLAMSQRLTLTQSLRAAWNHRALRSKVIEINLVMGIVKVALLVLTLVFSACPLPFSNVETQTFLNWWWFGCFLFWVISSDYFHVVRAAAVLRLTQAYDEA